MLTKGLQADKEPFSRAFWLCGAVYFLLVWALRLATLHGAFHPDDSPEITAAMAGLGVAHPPGYPLPTLLGRLAVLILPGAPAFASNALAALFSALGALLGLVLAARLLDPRERVGKLWLLIVALALASLPQLWFQGQSAKGGLYTLNLCLTLGAILSLQDGRQPKLGWLLIGLGLADHYMSFVLFLPTLAYWSWVQAPQLREQARRWLWSIPGLALYLYLPLRACFSPAINWGDPRTWAQFKAVLLRQMYSGAESGQDFGNALHLGRHFLDLWQEQWTWPGLVLLLLGIAPLWRLGSRWRPLLLGLALHLLVVLAYNHPPRNAPWVINAFFLPTFVLSVPLLLLGAKRSAERFKHSQVITLAFLIVGLWALPLRFRAQDYSRDYLVYDYAHDLIDSPAPNAALLAAGGNDAFPVWYLQQLEGRRRDLTLVDVPLIGGWYLDQLRPRLPELEPAWSSKDQVTQGLLSSTRRFIYYSSHNPGDRGIPYGLISLVPPATARLALSVQGLWGPWLATRLRWVADRRTPRDGNRDELLAYYPDSAAALERFARTQRVEPLVQGAAGLRERLRRASGL